MDLAHLHLLITHLPIFGSILGALVLALGIFYSSPATLRAAYLVLLVASLGGVIAFLTGEPAEETVEHIAGISKNTIENHEASAKITLVAIILLGILSITGLLALAKNIKSKTIAIVILVAALACFSIAAWTGYLGGKIRHTEIQKTSIG